MRKYSGNMRGTGEGVVVWHAKSTGDRKMACYLDAKYIRWRGPTIVYSVNYKKQANCRSSRRSDIFRLENRSRCGLGMNIFWLQKERVGSGTCSGGGTSCH